MLSTLMKSRPAAVIFILVTVTLDILARLRRLPGAARRLLSRHLAPIVENVRGLAVGRIEAEVPLE